MAAIRALELWCKTQCEGYRDVSISNMTTSFRSGLAFCALIHKFRPDLIDYDSLRKEDVFENNKLAFQVAEDKLGIPSLLDAEDMVALRIPDRLSILTYVSQYYNYFKGRPPVGGVKRPAEGSREEPSEKKNLPVVAKPFVTQPPEKRLPSPVLSSQTSPKLAGEAAETGVSSGNAAKNGTLSSQCVACRSHVHLVQRHFVEGRLYHRSCFTCSDCSCVLHVGGYEPGQEPDTFVCKAHKKAAPSEGWSQTSCSSERLNRSGQTHRSPRPSSVLSAPLKIALKPGNPIPPSQSWTTSAQRTQTDRQRFFQAPPETLASNRKSTETSSDDGRSKATENCNNNNKRPFTIRSAERRFGGEPSSADKPGPRKEKRSQGPAGSLAGQAGSSETNNKERSCPKAVSPDSTRPATAHSTDKDPINERRTQTNPVEPRPGLRKSYSGAEAFTGQHGFSDISTAKPPSAPPTAGSGGSFAPDGRTHLSATSPRKQLCGNFTGIHWPVKSPGRRRPDVESMSSSASAPTIHGDPPGAKKGKYLSPTNASRTEMRSPSVKSRHIPPGQIERELIDIETNLAQLEKEGVELEKQLRGCEEEGDGDVLMDPLMVDWFNLIRKKQMYIRKESELVYISRTQELELQQPGVEVELRRLLEKPDHLKSAGEQQRETVLMKTLMEIVDSRNAIVEGLDEDRRREVEEDERLNEMMKNLGVKKVKNKRKSSISKLFRRRSKRRVE